MASPSRTPSSVDRFIESWGTLGALWSVNRSVARIHALLIVSDDPLHLDQIAGRLGLSRGNVSMSLRELLMWGVIERTNRAGDRRDYFSAPADVWTMLFKIARERKRREFDPALAAIRDLVAAKDAPIGATPRTRLAELERLFGTMQRLLDVVLHDDSKGKTMFGFLTDLILRRP